MCVDCGCNGGVNDDVRGIIDGIHFAECDGTCNCADCECVSGADDSLSASDELYYDLQGFKLKNDISSKQLIKKHEYDAGLDIVSSQDVTVPARGSVVISTNLFVKIPNGFVGLMWSRSGLSVNHNIEVGAGCIDATYRGELKVHLYNHGNDDYHVSVNDKIAQLLTIPIFLNAYKEVDVLDETERGSDGFGSTGK